MAYAVGVIPARYASTRFPGKPLAPLEGRPLIQHVWERARRAARLDRVVVATDDERIREAVVSFGGEAVLTSPEHRSGTDRVAEAVRALEGRGMSIRIVVNIQGDEPLLDPAALDGLVRALEDDPALEYATLAERFSRAEDLLDPNTCKVVTDATGHALYFSRSPIPFFRSTAGEAAAGSAGIEALKHALGRRSRPMDGYLRHVGIYAFRRDALEAFSALPPGRLERMEGLEQLRILESGHRMRVVVSEDESLDVDTPEDLEMVRAILAGDRPGGRER